jgi:Asp-tRNA(Asn)/Glu-tRNA(Gln) amidotransferase A subunit family amidase
LQLTGRAWGEAALFRAGAAYERLTPWSAQAPRG